jgi:hypothetical protein
MLEVLRSAMEGAPNGCKVDVTFHDDASLKGATILSADQLGIVIESEARKFLHRLIPWTAIAVLDVHHY